MGMVERWQKWVPHRYCKGGWDDQAPGAGALARTAYPRRRRLHRGHAAGDHRAARRGDRHRRVRAGPSPHRRAADGPRPGRAPRRGSGLTAAGTPCPLPEAIAEGPVVLDGGLATLLEARGHDLSSQLWSARLLGDDPEAIAAAHAEFFTA